MLDRQAGSQAGIRKKRGKHCSAAWSELKRYLASYVALKYAENSWP